MKHTLFSALLLLVTIGGLRAQDATPVHAEWAIESVATLTDAANNGFALCEMSVSNLIYPDTKSDITLGENTITMVRFHHAENGAKTGWPNESAPNATRYVDFALKAPADKDIHVTQLSLTVSGYSSNDIHCAVEAAWGSAYENARTILEDKALTHASAEQLNLSTNLVIAAGQTIHIRILPWRQGASGSGKYICIKDVEFDGEAVAAGTPVEPETYTVTFLDWDGTELNSQEVEEGKAAVAPTDPVRDGYTFTGWDKDFSHVYSDLEVTAQYKQNAIYREVTFLDWDGSEIDVSTVEFGCAVEEAAHPTREGYLFTGWSGGFGPVYQNVTVTAQYVALADADEDIQVAWPLTEHHGGNSNGYAEPFAQTKQGADDKFYCQAFSAQFPEATGRGTDYPVQMMSAQGDAWQLNATTYNSDFFVEFAFKAAENIKVNDVHLYAGSYGLNNMRFSVLYALNEDFEDSVLIEHTEAQPTYVMAEVDWGGLNIAVAKDQIFRLRVFPWLDNAGEAYMNRQWFFLLSDVKIGASLDQEEPPVDPNPEQGIDDVQSNIQCTKIFRDGQLLIQKNDKLYTTTGVEL